MPPQKARKIGRRLQILEDDGPACFTAVLSHKTGRWHSSFTSLACNRPAQHYLNELLKTHGLEDLNHSDAPVEWQLQGYVIMSAWRITPMEGQGFVASAHDAESGLTPRQILHNLLLRDSAPTGCRAVLEFPILAAAFFEEPWSVPLSMEALNMGNSSLDSASTANLLWNHTPMASTIFEATPEGPQKLELQSLWRRWAQRFQLHLLGGGCPPVLGWRCWTPIARLMVRGLWPLDATAVLQRVRGQFAVRLRTECPPAKLVQDYLQLKDVASLQVQPC